MQGVARQAILQYVKQHSREDLLGRILDERSPGTPRPCGGSVNDLPDAA